jgi:hypothetical protein
LAAADTVLAADPPKIPPRLTLADGATKICEEEVELSPGKTRVRVPRVEPNLATRREKRAADSPPKLVNPEDDHHGRRQLNY